MRIQGHTPLLVITLIPSVLMALLFLFVGVSELVGPHVPESALPENTVVCVILILTAVGLIWALLRPFSGGVFLCISALPFGFTFNAFHLSEALYPSRPVGYTHFWSALTGLVLLLGVLALLRARDSRRPFRPA